MKFLGNDDQIDEEAIKQRVGETRDLYTHKIQIFSEENTILEKEVADLRSKAEALRSELFTDDLSEMGDSVAGGKTFSVGSLGVGTDLDGYENMFSDLDSMIESISIRLD